jgi:hypothetical protein
LVIGDDGEVQLALLDYEPFAGPLEDDVCDGQDEEVSEAQA